MASTLLRALAKFTQQRAITTIARNPYAMHHAQRLHVASAVRPLQPTLQDLEVSIKQKLNDILLLDVVPSFNSFMSRAKVTNAEIQQIAARQAHALNEVSIVLQAFSKTPVGKSEAGQECLRRQHHICSELVKTNATDPKFYQRIRHSDSMMTSQTGSFKDAVISSGGWSSVLGRPRGGPALTSKPVTQLKAGLRERNADWEELGERFRSKGSSDQSSYLAKGETRISDAEMETMPSEVTHWHEKKLEDAANMYKWRFYYQKQVE